MRDRTLNTTGTFCVNVAAAGSSLTGCATTGTERAAKATTNIQTVEAEYRQIPAQVDLTNATLKDLISPDQTDVKKAFQAFKSNADKMEKLENQLEKNSAEMTAKGNDYFMEWEKENKDYTNPQIRQLSEERRLQLREEFAQIPQASVGVKGSLNAYVTQMKDIEKFFSNDLTAKGIEKMTPVARQAIQDGEAVKTSVNPVLAAIKRVETALKPGRPREQQRAASSLENSSPVTSLKSSSRKNRRIAVKQEVRNNTALKK